MTKNRYDVQGVTAGEIKFKATCVAFDIVSAINLFRNKNMSVHLVTSRTQVNANLEVKIENIEKIK